MTFELRRVTIDGQPAIKLRCPGCQRWAEIDDDQFHGRVSIWCDTEDGGCGWHETHDLATVGTFVESSARAEKT